MNASLDGDSHRHSPSAMYPGFAGEATARANRRRFRVFLGTLLVALAISLSYTFLRPAEYRATARVEITPGVGSVSPIGRAGQPVETPSESPKTFLTEVQVLTSRPVLERAANLVQRAGRDLSSFGPDPVDGIQARLEVNPVASTNVVELIATNAQPELTAPVINAVISVYRDHVMEAYREATKDTLATASEETKKLEAAVAAKRREVEAFRRQHNIVSLERDENAVLARVKNQNIALAAANERVATAEGRLRSLTESAAAGRSVVRARDDPTLANLEQRASQAREEMRDLERSYTPEYLAKDPRVIALRTRIAELDRQVKVQRETSKQAALHEAQQDLASAEEAARRLQRQMTNDRQQVGEFTARFNEYKSRQEELAELETAYRSAVQRKVRFEASERARMPSIKILEAATTPQQPWRPLYWRDAAISGAASLLLALLAMWLVELFNRPEPQPAVVITQSLGALPYARVPGALLAEDLPPQALASQSPRLLSQQPPLPRELSEEQAEKLIRAAGDADRSIIMFLLSGVSRDELVALRWDDVDLKGHVVELAGTAARQIPLSESLRQALGAQPAHGAGDWLIAGADRAAVREDIDTRLLCVAHDAGLDDASDVTADCLRHTYITYLLRQGIKFSELARIVGPLPRAVLAQYSNFSAPERRTPSGEIETTHPALRAR